MARYFDDDEATSGRRDVVVALVVVVLGGVLTLLPPSLQEEIAAGIRGSALRPFLATQEALADTRVRAARAADLRARVDSLVAQLAAQAPLEEENRRLRRLLALSERAGPRFRAAEVVRPGIPGSESMFLADIGRVRGIEEGAPVVTAAGLVGVIREVSDRVSVGMDWTHPEFRASAMTADGTSYGIVEPRRGRFREEDRMVLTGIAYHTTLEPGTEVVTSGRGGVYPRGIPLGTVVGVEEAEAGWRKSYGLEAAVRPGSVTHVLVSVPGGGETPGVDTTAVRGLWSEVRDDTAADSAGGPSGRSP